jgi:hypothetical protein
MQILHSLPAPFPPLPSEGPHHQAPAAAAIRRELTDANSDLQGALAILAGCCDLTPEAQALGVEVRQAMAQVVRLAEALEDVAKQSGRANQ